MLYTTLSLKISGLLSNGNMLCPSKCLGFCIPLSSTRVGYMSSAAVGVLETLFCFPLGILNIRGILVSRCIFVHLHHEL